MRRNRAAGRPRSCGRRRSDIPKLLRPSSLTARMFAPSPSGGFTALVFAAAKNDRASAEALLAAGADPNYALPDGHSVLIVAASYRSVDVANLLADRGANPNAADRQGETPLHIAARSGDLALVQKLLAKGANVNARTVAEPVPAKTPTDNDGRVELCQRDSRRRSCPPPRETM